MGVIAYKGILYGGGSGSDASHVFLTKAEYDALPDDKLTNNVIYMIEDMPGSDGIAENVLYDNSISALSADSVQGAIDEVGERLRVKTAVMKPNPEIGMNFTVKQMGNIIALNIQTVWLQWNNSNNILIGQIATNPITYISREVIFMLGDGRVAGIGNVSISNTDIIVQTPSDWVDGAYAHMLITLSFYV